MAASEFSWVGAAIPTGIMGSKRYASLLRIQWLEDHPLGGLRHFH
jgi:hypothetical protein